MTEVEKEAYLEEKATKKAQAKSQAEEKKLEEVSVFKKIAKDLKIGKKDEIIKELPLFASENLKKVNFFKSLITSINYLIWGDV